jgi:SOS-response transcriptional repressor LexA
MSWASCYIIALREAGFVEFCPRGTSMEPLVMDKQPVRCILVREETELSPGDIVLCTVNGRQYLQLIKAVNGERYLIGNNRGGLNGWTPRKHIYGIVVATPPRDGVGSM